MARGYAWKHRNDPPRGYTKRVTEKRELASTPQYTLDDLYITPFKRRQKYDEDGHKYYVNIERNTSPTGIHVMDDYLRYLAAGQSDIGAFVKRHGIRTEELAALVFILTGQKNMIFRQPCPGPGLAVRITGEINEEKLEILREADAIFREFQKQ